VPQNLTIIKTRSLPSLSLTHTVRYTYTQTQYILPLVPRKLWPALERAVEGFLCLSKIHVCEQITVFPALWNMGPGCTWRIMKRKLYRPAENCKCPFFMGNHSFSLSSLNTGTWEIKSPFSFTYTICVQLYTWNLIIRFPASVCPITG